MFGLFYFVSIKIKISLISITYIQYLLIFLNSWRFVFFLSEKNNSDTNGVVDLKNISQNSNKNDELASNYQEIRDDEKLTKVFADSEIFPEELSTNNEKKVQNNVLKSSLKNNDPIMGEKKVPGKSLVSGERKKSILDDLLNFDEDDWGTNKKVNLKAKSESQPQMKMGGSLKLDNKSRKDINGDADDDDGNNISFGSYTPSITTPNKRQVR